MANANELTAHEMLELHEILRNENLCIKKNESNASIVKDHELASFIQSSVSTRRQKLQEMKQFISSGLTIQ